jgi:hypothetical protein
VILYFIYIPKTRTREQSYIKGERSEIKNKFPLQKDVKIPVKEGLNHGRFPAGKRGLLIVEDIVVTPLPNVPSSANNNFHEAKTTEAR